MSLDFDNIILKVDDRVVELGTSEVPILAISVGTQITTWGDIQGKPTTFPPSSHKHGNITNAGAITSDTAIANGDKIIVSDASASGKLIRSGISFDGESDLQALTRKGTWREFLPSETNFDDRYYKKTQTYTKNQIDDQMEDKAKSIINTVCGDPAEFSDSLEGVAKRVVINIEPVQWGSDDPSPTNVRPITGWVSSSISVGKNKGILTPRNLANIYNATLGESNSTLVIAEGTYAQAEWDLHVQKGKTYTISYRAVASHNASLMEGYLMRVYYKNGESQDYQVITNEWTNYSYSFTADSDIFTFIIRVTTSATSGDITVTNYQLELGDTATDYEPYGTYTYVFSNTVYGGNIYVNTGRIEVLGFLEHVKSCISVQNGGIATIIQGAKPPADANTRTSVKASYLKTLTANELWHKDTNAIATRANGNIVIYIVGCTTKEQVDAYLTEHPLDVFYEIEDPHDMYFQTPHDIELASGENSISADTGSVTVTYHVDTKLYVDQSVSNSRAETESHIADVKTDFGYIESMFMRSASGTIAMFDTAASVPMKEMTVDLLLKQIGTGDPSPSNIRPILGKNLITINQISNNLFTYDDASKYANKFVNEGTGKIQGNQKSYTIYVPVEEDKRYTIIKKASSRFIVAYTASLPATNVPLITGSSWRDDSETSYTSLAPTGAQYLCATVVNTDYDNYDDILSSMVVFETGTETVTTISWGSEAGVVFQGSLNLKTGVLTVTHGYYYSYEGEQLPGAWVSDRDVYVEGTTPTIGAQIVYELAEPVIYHINPTKITALPDKNIIWVGDAEDNVSLVYQVDIISYVDKKTAELQALILEN